MIDAVYRALALEDEVLALNLGFQVLFVARHQHLIDGVIHHIKDVIAALIGRPLENMSCPNGSICLWARLIKSNFSVEVDIVRPSRPRGVQGLGVQMELFFIVASHCVQPQSGPWTRIQVALHYLVAL
jgi:hypothetical protein